jgi:predicted PurR-regulated permease PerM
MSDGYRAAEVAPRHDAREAYRGADGATARSTLEVSISIRTMLLVAGAVALAWAVDSIANVLLVLFVALFGVAVLSPVVTGIERRLRFSRGACSLVLVLGIVLIAGVVLLVVVQAVSGAVQALSGDVPEILDKVRQSGLGSLIDDRSGALETLRTHARDITSSVGWVSAGVAHVGVTAFEAITLAVSIVVLTHLGLVDEPRVRHRIGSLLYRDDRERFLRVTDRIIQTTSRYMLGNLAISLVCGTVYGVTALILGVPYALALAVIAGILDLIPNIGATIAGLVVALVALSVGLEALIAFGIVMVVYQQVENYVLQPAIIGKAAQVSGFTVLASVLVFGALFGLVGAIVAVPIAAGIQIVAEELTAPRRARIAAAEPQPPA